MKNVKKIKKENKIKKEKKIIMKKMQEKWHKINNLKITIINF